MPKVRTLVPLTHPKTGENFAVGTEVDVDDEVFRDWRADGKALSIDDEKKAQEAAKEGSYSARTSRTDAGEAKAEEPRAPREKK
jgi:hypothetical protein